MKQDNMANQNQEIESENLSSDNEHDKNITASVDENDDQTENKIDLNKLTVDQWMEKLADVEKLAAERLDGQQRALAEFQNFKRRTTKENQAAHQNAAADVLSNFFSIVDDLELAIKSLPDDESTTWGEGFKMIHKKIIAIFENQQLIIIKADPGDQFDPHIHEAIIQESHSEYDTDIIISMLQQGYMINERVLRPAQVRVAK
ncbi:MAG TPA: nucleotide exchange factor GrpE [Chloroflexi bacterium]|nr:nucleotide exchange factor GrpE [Chloroflexota bacterium]|tara:strand:+ start:1038 stop:1646 length:609 start_codon:yes stop_codon:yes gene_type:complete